MPSTPKDPRSYISRDYRRRVDSTGLSPFEIKVKETDLYIAARGSNASSIALNSVVKYRNYIEEYIKARPEFLTSLHPIEEDLLAPAIVQDMMTASRRVGVGPMAAVAGAIAQFVGRDILEHSPEVVVENGGDIFMKRDQDVLVGVFAGSSPLNGKLKLLISAGEMPLGICTSSATVGHSLSLGKADAVCVLSKSASLADAAATAIGNLVTSANTIRKAIDFGSVLDGVDGILIVIGDKMGAWGKIEFA